MRRAVAALAVAAALAPAGLRSSGASFTATSANPAEAFAAAADFNTVAVSLTDPGTPLRGSVALSATASSGRGIASVTFQVAPAGTGSWSTACTATSAPYSCSFDTNALADGLVDVRAVALDAAGYARTDTVTARRVDNTAPTTSLTDSGSPLRGTISLSGGAVDTGSGIASVAVEERPSGGGSWSTVCAAASCSWATTAVPDGLYDVRLTATDAAGNSSSSVVSARRVDNSAPTVTMSDPGATLAGSVTLQSSAADGGSGVASVRYEYRASPTGSWTTACTSAGAPFSCAWSTMGVADGVYDLRAVATDAAGNTATSAVVSSRRVDNTAPATASLSDPGSPLGGTVSLSASASDAGSGIASVRVERAPANGSTWTAVCTATTSPYSCTWDTTAVADALYDLRVVATDVAGNARTSSVVANRRVDNNGPTVALSDPGAYLRGSVTLDATASDPAGVQSVAFAYKPSAGSTWTTICTDATSPYGCPWNTTALADGGYDVRALASDVYGHQSTAVVSGRQVDNTAPRALSVGGANGGTSGKLDSGDTLTLTFSETVAAASLLSGWDGSTHAVNVAFNKSGSNTTIAISDSGGAAIAALGTLSSSSAWVKPGGATFTATMRQSGAAITVTLGTTSNGGNLQTGVSPGTLTWASSTAVADLAGNAGAGNSVSGTDAL